MDPIELLREDREEMPEWLLRYAPNERFDARQFFGGRTVFYPGCGDDGHPLRVFGKAHAAHSFVFVDYGFPESHYAAHLRDASHPEHPKGYRPISVRSIDIHELGATNWTPHHRGPTPDSIAAAVMKRMGRPFGLFSVHQRLEGFGSEHGPKRIAILVLGADGAASYDGLYCQGGSPPYAVLLQDHGFGGNWDRFGAGGVLQKLATDFNLPTWLLVADNTKPWPGYQKVSDSTCGGMHNHARFLWKKQT